MEFLLNNRVVLSDIDQRAAEEIKNRLTYVNPEYRKLQRLGKWTGRTPEKVRFYEEKNGALICPRGFADQAYRISRQYHDKIEVVDKRVALKKVEIDFYGSLKDFQKEAADAALKESHGVISAGTGSGKTVIALYVISERKQPALVMVHTLELMHQWLDRVEKFLHISSSDAGIIGAGKFRIGEKITIGLYQSIRSRTEELDQFFGHIIVDECHKCPSKTFTEAVTGMSARFRLGLTATAYRRDGLGDLIYLSLGEQRYFIEKAPLIERGDISRAEVICRPTEFNTLLDASSEYPRVIKEITLDASRNALICKDIAEEDMDGIRLILTDRREHAAVINRTLKSVYGLESRVLTGSTPKNERESILVELGDGSVNTLIATGQLVGEGFDLPELSTLFLVTPIKFKGRLIQYIGRVLRPAPGKDMAVIYDYVDVNVAVLKASAAARQRIYREEGISVECEMEL